MLVTEQNYKDVELKLAKIDTWVVDVETNGLDPFGKNQICGLGVGTLEGETYYFPFRHQQGINLPIEMQKNIIALANLRKTLIGYNLKFDLHFLAAEGLEVLNKTLIDVIVMVRLTEPSEEKEMGLSKTIIRSYGQEAAQYDIDTKKYLRSNKWHKDFSLAPSDILGEYCEKDVVWTTKLYIDRLNKIKATKQERIFALECELTKVLYEMENAGVQIDTDYARNSQDKIQERQEQLANKIFDLVGEFNINSTQQLCEVMNANGIFSPLETPKGAQSWGEMALVQINNPFAGFVRQYRALGKLLSTYLEPYTESPTMHTNFCNWGTLTGRLSSREPNLQNIPRNHFKLSDVVLNEEERHIVRGRINALISSKGGTVNSTLDDDVIDTWGFVGDESYEEADSTQIAVRRLFTPRPEYSLVAFDYSQMEVRVFLSYFQNEEIEELLKQSDIDFHGEAAKLAFNVNEEDKGFKEFRQMAKAITFGTIYGIGSKKLAVQLGITPKQALEYKRKYFAGLKGSKEFFDQVVQAVTIKGFIKNRYGRLYRVPKNLGYKGVNYLVQGTSADILSERMIEVASYLRNTKSRLLLQVHDEVICEVHKDDLKTVPHKIKELMEINSLDIPLYVDMEFCNPSWANKIDFEKPLTEDKEDDIVDYIDWN
jgi:DNA polymerase-1